MSSPAHLVERYGRDEVRRWGFEVWNEANLDVFWSGTREEYLRLYDISARAVKAVDGGLVVGGPASAAADWVDELLAHCARAGSPIDFVYTHTYGNAPLDLRPIAARYGLPGVRQWWTEWGAHATHFNRVHDPRGAARISCGAWPQRWAGSRRSPTGRCRTTSRSSDGRQAAARRLRAAGGRQPCASRGGGGCGCSSSSGRAPRGGRGR